MIPSVCSCKVTQAPIHAELPTESKQLLVSTQIHFSSPEASPIKTGLHQSLLMHPVNHRYEVFPAEALDLTVITLMVLFQ